MEFRPELATEDKHSDNMVNMVFSGIFKREIARDSDSNDDGTDVAYCISMYTKSWLLHDGGDPLAHLIGLLSIC